MKYSNFAIGLAVAVTMFTSRGSASAFREPECNPAVVPGANYWCIEEGGEQCSLYGAQALCEVIMAQYGCSGTIYNSYCGVGDCLVCYWSPLS